MHQEAANTGDLTALFKYEDSLAGLEAGEQKQLDDGAAPPLPWVNAMVPPTNPPGEPAHVPPHALEMEWCYGYRSHDTRGSVVYNRRGEVLWHCAGLTVALSKEERRQRLNADHTDDVLCLAISPDGRHVATG